MILALIFLAQAVIGQEAFTLPQNCSLPLHRGTTCAQNNPSIRYYMDATTLTCLAFQHKGCGGNANSYETKDACMRSCIPMDFMSCPVNSPPVKREDGTAHCGDGPMDPQCPKGSFCRRGFAVGLCCDQKMQDKMNANYKPDCGPGKKVHLSEQYGFQLIHLGKTCDHEFCPSSTSCQQGEFFAYCCA